MHLTKLLSPAIMGKSELRNRVVMAPMSRARATGSIANEMMAEYYKQRSSAGLIISEGTSPSPNGNGFIRTPGIFTDEQIAGWKKTTDAVHTGGGKIVLQLRHTGRISSSINLPEEGKVVAPSAVAAEGKIWTDKEGMQNFTAPLELSAEDLKVTKAEYLTAIKNAMKAGFDGVELDCANGYLPEQFISPVTNTRKDKYGKSIENRCRFILEIIEKATYDIGQYKIGVRLSPFSTANDMTHYDEIYNTYKYLVEKLESRNLLYLHLVKNPEFTSTPEYAKMEETIRHKFKGAIVVSGAYTPEAAENELVSGRADFISFGRLFISNPDLVSRMTSGQLNADLPSEEFLYTAEAEGYTDYPIFTV